jgi:hypothetical protein
VAMHGSPLARANNLIGSCPYCLWPGAAPVCKVVVMASCHFEVEMPAVDERARGARGEILLILSAVKEPTRGRERCPCASSD